MFSAVSCRFLNSAVTTLSVISMLCALASTSQAATLSISGGLTEIEGDSGFGNPVSFQVNLSAPSAQTVTVNVNTADGTAKAGVDYSTTNLTLSFAPGETTQSFVVPVIGDTLDENTETFFVFLSSPTNATIGTGRGTGTIFNDDSPPLITIDDVRIGEGNSGQRVAAFRLNLSEPSGKVVRVSYETVNGTAISGSDYVSVAPTVAAFSTGSTVAYARVFINGDTLNEADETFSVNLSSPNNGTIEDSQATGTILNDDRAPSLIINDVSVTEGGSRTITLLTFTVSLSAASGQNISVNFATADGTAKSTSDYAAKNGTLNFQPGRTSTTIIIGVNGDLVVEPNETLYVLLSGATNASIGRGRGTGIINNDDSSVVPRD